ncbi:MAG: hypothetical protein KME31_22520 [Tolypothrix carrinoi HA7290-LM1]|nr:hypothetical protein [Tolypothrix carrinoi HA7290-LM1]
MGNGQWLMERISLESNPNTQYPIPHYPFGFASRLRRETLPQRWTHHYPLPITNYLPISCLVPKQ